MSEKTKVNFNATVMSVLGEPAKNETGGDANLGKIIGDHIASGAADKNIVKLWGWAVDMAKGNDIVLDSEDFTSLRSYIELLPRCPVFVKAQAIDLMNKAKA